MPSTRVIAAVLLLCAGVNSQWGSRFAAQQFADGVWDVSVHEAPVGDPGLYGKTSSGKLRVRGVGGYSLAESYTNDGTSLAFKIHWSSGSEGQLTHRSAEDLSSRIHESVGSMEEDEEAAASYSWSSPVAFAFRTLANGIATAQGPVTGGGDQFHINAVSDSHVVMTVTMREGAVFPSWKVFTVTANRVGSGGSSYSGGPSWVSAYSGFLIPITFVISRMVQDRQGM